MNVRQLVENCVIMNQTVLVGELSSRGLLPEECLCPFDGDIMEWWLIDGWLAERLKREGECIVSAFGCCWWGRTTSGQAVWLDDVIGRIARG